MSNRRLRKQRRDLRRQLVDLQRLHNRKIDHLLQEMARQRYEDEMLKPSVWHNPWNYPTALINEPVLERIDLRPRLFCRSVQIDSEIISRQTRRGEAAMLSYIEEECARDIAKKLIKDGYVRIDWAQQAGAERYGDRRVEDTMYFHWAVLISQVKQVTAEPINPSYKLKEDS